MNSMENIDTDVQGWRVKGLVFINALRRGGEERMSLKGITWLSKGTEGGWQADKVSRGDYRKLTASKGGVGP